MPLATALGDARRRYQLFYAFQFAAYSGFVVFRNVYLEEMGMSGTQMGVVGFLLTLAGVLAQPVWGVVTDWGRVEKAVLITGSLVSAAGLTLYPLADQLAEPFLVVAIGTVTFAAFRAPLVPIANSLVLAKGFDFGGVRAYGSIAFGIGSLGFGFVIAGLGTASIVWLYGIGMLALVAVIWGLPVDVETDGDGPADTSEESAEAGVSTDGSGGGLTTSSRRLLANVDYLALLLVAFLTGATTRGGSAFFSVYMREIAAGDELTGIAWAIKTAFEAVVFLYVARVGLSYKTLLVVGGLGSAAPNFVYYLTTATVPILAVQSLGGLGFALFTVAAVNLAHDLAGESVRATAQSVLTAAGLGIGGAVGQAIAGRLHDLVGVQDMYVYIGAIGLMAAAAAFLVRGVDETPDGAGV